MGPQPFEAVVAAEGLSQETFRLAFRAYRSLGPNANVRAWLFAIATNLYRNHVRTESRRRTAHATVRARSRQADGEGPEGEALFNEARAMMEVVVERLPLKQRLAFVLRKIHDVPYDQIGKGLGCSPEAARAHVFQAFKKIRHGLDGHLLPATEVRK